MLSPLDLRSMKRVLILLLPSSYPFLLIPAHLSNPHNKSFIDFINISHRIIGRLYKIQGMEGKYNRMNIKRIKCCCCFTFNDTQSGCMRHEMSMRYNGRTPSIFCYLWPYFCSCLLFAKRSKISWNILRQTRIELNLWILILYHKYNFLWL